MIAAAMNIIVIRPLMKRPWHYHCNPHQRERASVRETKGASKRQKVWGGSKKRNIRDIVIRIN